MVDYDNKAPGVYIEEITPAGPLAGAGTSTPALIGVVAKDLGDTAYNMPVPIANWTAYTKEFDGYRKDPAVDPNALDLPCAVRGFFENGGQSAYVVPVKDNTDLDDALLQLTRFPEVSMVCVPGLVDVATQKTVIAHCENMGDRFAILDGASDDAPPFKDDGALKTQRKDLLSRQGYAALYWPWIKILDPAPALGKVAGLVSKPPSGHIAGIMARCDGTVGVHKAPANEPVRGAVDLDHALSDSEQSELNNQNINVLRSFPGRPPLVWGARTLTDGTPWRYVNVRRLVLYIEDSILQGVRWAVFAPNNPALWKGLERTITEFLTRVWESGALFGRTAKDAFYVKIDEENNPRATRDLGQVFVEIGLAPVSPAEKIILRLGLWDGGTRVTES